MSLYDLTQTWQMLDVLLEASGGEVTPEIADTLALWTGESRPPWRMPSS